MSQTLQERRDMNPQYMWDLSSLYASDEDWKKALPTLEPMVEEAAAFQGKLKDAGSIRAFYDKSEKLELLLSDLFEYAMLRRSEDTRAAAGQKMHALIYGKYVRAMARLSFAKAEILSLEEEKLRAIVEDPALADYRQAMEDLLEEKSHTLSADQEELLAQYGEVFGATANISENLMDADMVFEDAVDAAGKPHQVSGSSYIRLQSSADRLLRKNAFDSLYKGYRQHINTLASTYATAVKTAVTTARVRHYASSRRMAMEANHIPDQVYQNLIEAVRRHMPAMYRYVALRKRLLGLEELHYYDLYAPLVGESAQSYTYEQARRMVLDAIAPLGEEYKGVVKRAFADRWIDVYPNAGKRGGAFSAGTYHSKPYILTNFSGTLDSVSTIAHEMGHSMHSWYARSHQPAHYADYTLFVAEVASTVNENLLIENLLGKTSDLRERLVLLNQYLENFKGTVYRQTMFAEFEKIVHEKAEEGQALDPETLNRTYLDLIRDYFGEGLVIDDAVKYEWARIPHFYRPFYVYVYATGYSSAVALSEGIRRDGVPAVRRYLDFLSMGSSRHPLDELRHAGVDLDTPAPLDQALEKFETVLDQAEEIARELGL